MAGFLSTPSIALLVPLLPEPRYRGLNSYQHRNEAETAEQRTIKRRLQHGYFQSQPARG
jgi:hypothetical protein